MAISESGNTLFVADTYNHKLKKVDTSKNSVTTLCGAGEDAVDGDPHSFREPGGLCVSADGKKLYLADTNNHCIKILALDKELSVRNIQKLNIQLYDKRCLKSKTKYKIIQAAKSVGISAGGGKLILQILTKFEDNLKLTSDAVQNWNVDFPDALWSSAPSGGNFTKLVDTVITVPPAKYSENEAIDIKFDLLLCTKDTCLPKNYIIRQPIIYLKNGATSATHYTEVFVKLTEISVI